VPKPNRKGITKRKKEILASEKSEKAFPVTEEKSYAVRDAVTEKRCRLYMIG
jgi:hypothetical protein